MRLTDVFRRFFSKVLMTDTLKFSDLPPMNPLTMKKDIQGVLDFLNSQPEINWDDKQLY